MNNQPAAAAAAAAPAPAPAAVVHQPSPYADVDASTSVYWEHIRSRYLFNNESFHMIHSALSLNQFFVYIFENLQETNLVFYGGVLRDTHLAPIQRSKYQSDEDDVRIDQYEAHSILTPNDIDCKFPEDLHQNGRNGARNRWNVQFNSLVALLKDLVGARNVRDDGFAKIPAGYQHIDIRVRTLHVTQPGHYSGINIDVSAPSYIPIDFNEEEEEDEEEERKDELIPMEKSLDMDVNGLISYPNKDRKSFDLHPILVGMGVSVEEVLDNIKEKTFYVVASDKLKATPKLWDRVFKRLKSGWIGHFELQPGGEVYRWRSEGCHVAVNSAGGGGIRMSPLMAASIAEAFGYVPPHRNECDYRGCFSGRGGLIGRGGRRCRGGICQYNEVMDDRKESEEDKVDRKTCVACMDKDPEHMVVGCNHLCLCEQCLEKIHKLPQEEHKCPVCRNPIKSTIRVFMS